MKILSFQPQIWSDYDRESLRNIFMNGGVIAFPSDTAYGFAADPRNKAAVEKVYTIKGRLRENALSCIFSTIKEAKKWADVSEEYEKILRRYLPGAFTFILPSKTAYPMQGAVGIRIPDSDLTRTLSRILKAPYTATSANLSGNASIYSAEQVAREFEHTNEQPDIILDAGPLLHGALSTVVDLTGDMPKIVREGNERLFLV